MSWFTRKTPESRAEQVVTVPEPIIVHVPAPTRPESLPEDTGNRLRAMVQTCRMWYLEHLPYNCDIPTGLLQEYGRLLESSAREWFTVGPDEPCDRILAEWRDSWWNFLNTRMDVFRIDGAQSHRDNLRETEEWRATLRRMSQLRDIANRPIDYGAPADASVVEVAPNVMYGEFAAQLREVGVPEKELMPLLTQLAELVKQYREIVPTLTADMAKQFEARILVDRFDAEDKIDQDRQWRLMGTYLDTAPAALEKSSKELENLHTPDALDSINDQLAMLNQTAQRQSESLSTMKWLHIIDGLFGK